jgi:hypothetical protein
MKTILFNGPPSAGKDTAAKFLWNSNSNPVLFERFSAPLKTAFSAITGKPYNQFFEVEWYESHKEEVIPWLGVSYRQWQIDFSEKFMKPNYGKDIFGKLFVERLWGHQKRFDNPYKCCVVPDSGFDIEIEYLEQHVSIDEVLLVRVHRDGCDFSKDSRNYVYSDKFFSLDVHNNGTQEAFENTIGVIYQNFVYHNYNGLTNGGTY